MYEAFYGLKEKPFSLTPDPDFLYFSPGHKRALTYLTYGLESQEGFVQVTGEIGSGKTTILRSLLRNLAPDIKTAYVVNPRGTFRQLLRTILDELDVVPMTTEMSKEKLLREFRQFLEQQSSAGHPVVLIFDEAQNLDNSALEEIRMLSNFETNKRKLVQIVLVGQPELRDKLNSPELQQLHQRIAVRCHLGPLTAEETAKYIEHRLRIAGAQNGAVRFGTDAYRLIHYHTRGVPRLINVMCNAMLLAGFIQEKKRFTGRDVDAALSDLAEAEGVAPLPPPPAAAPGALDESSEAEAAPEPAPAATAVASAAPVAAKPRRRRWVVRAAIIAGAIVVLGAAALGIWHYLVP